jgi:hypothetical protein
MPRSDVKRLLVGPEILISTQLAGRLVMRGGNLGIAKDRAQAITRAEAALVIYEQIESPYAKMVRDQLTEWKASEEEV